MIITSREQKRSVRIFVAFMVASLAGLLLLPPILQEQTYHDFADQRPLLGIAFRTEIATYRAARRRQGARAVGP
jgi:hypothetical protein